MISKEIYKSFDKKNVLVTGGTGLVGRQICDLLVENTSAYVVSVSLDRLKLNDKVNYRYGDLSDFRGFYDLLKKENIHFVFHVAGIKGSPRVTKEKPASFFTAFLQMNTNVLEASRLANVNKLIYTSSIGAYSSWESMMDEECFNVDDIEDIRGIFKEEYAKYFAYSPMDSFPGWAKRMGELQIKAYKIEYGLDYSCVRLGNVYGIGDNFDPNNAMVIPSLISKIYEQQKFDHPYIEIFGDGTAIRDFAYSEDIAKGIILALYHGTGNGFYNLGRGFGYKIHEVIRALRDIIPFEYSYMEEKSIYSKRVLDISLAEEKLGFNPNISLKEGLEKTWNWFQKNQNEYLQRKNYFK